MKSNIEQQKMIKYNPVQMSIYKKLVVSCSLYVTITRPEHENICKICQNISDELNGRSYLFCNACNISALYHSAKSNLQSSNFV